MTSRGSVSAPSVLSPQGQVELLPSLPTSLGARRSCSHVPSRSARCPPPPWAAPWRAPPGCGAALPRKRRTRWGRGGPGWGGHPRPPTPRHSLPPPTAPLSPLCVRPAGAAQRGGAEASHRGGPGQAGVRRGGGSGTGLGADRVCGGEGRGFLRAPARTVDPGVGGGARWRAGLGRGSEAWRWAPSAPSFFLKRLRPVSPGRSLVRRAKGETWDGAHILPSSWIRQQGLCSPAVVPWSSVCCQTGWAFQVKSTQTRQGPGPGWSWHYLLEWERRSWVCNHGCFGDVANQDESPKPTVEKWILRVRCYDLSESGGRSGAQSDVVFMLWQKRQNITQGCIYGSHMRLETSKLSTQHWKSLVVDLC